MTELLECVPNFSEGRVPSTLDAIRAAMTRTGTTILDVQSDRDHNRSVFTLIGSKEALLESVFNGMETALDFIDLRSHEGAHPRMGAIDVVPFIPVLDTTMETAIEASRELATRVATELNIPVFFYEESATRPERKNLEQIRGKGFEELAELVGVDPAHAPDLGPSTVHATAGATVIGARRALIAYNIYLDTTNLKIAQSIARAVRHSTGGLRYVKAMGFNIPERGCVQVSMNLTNHPRTAMHTAFELVREAANSFGVAVTDSEVVGLVPAAALFDVARHYLRMHELRDEQVLEMRLLESD